MVGQEKEDQTSTSVIRDVTTVVGNEATLVVAAPSPDRAIARSNDLVPAIARSGPDRAIVSALALATRKGASARDLGPASRGAASVRMVAATAR